MNCLDISNGEMVCPVTEIGDALYLPNTGGDFSLLVVIAAALIFSGLLGLLYLRLIRVDGDERKQATDRTEI